MTTIKSLGLALLGASALALSACGGGTETAAPKAEEAAKMPAITLASIVAHPRRAEAAARDKFRNPIETLEFFGVEPSMNVGEVWGGWYTPILAPHNWMGGGYADKAFSDFYAALKPGGILGVVEHRLPESSVQDPKGRSGYVQESYMKDLAIRAGFEFVGSSEVNANPRDTADHPMGVWTLPPRSAVPKEGSANAKDFNAALYKNIGESDRATLKFKKPL